MRMPSLCPARTLLDARAAGARRIAAAALAVGVVIGLPGCSSAPTTREGTVGVDRHQTLLLSSDQMNQGAAQAYGEIVAQARQKGALDRDPAAVQRVRTVTQRLIPQTKVFRDDAPSWPWETHVLTSPEVNAWCMPGGKIAVYTGIIEKLQLTDDELAAILGHEIAHALREHSRERASRQVATATALSVAGAVLGVGDAGVNLANMVANVTLTLPNSRTQETEADRIGIELAARAGYDPSGAVRLWEKMAKASEGAPPQFLSTHPSNESRLADLRGYAEKVRPLYLAARR